MSMKLALDRSRLVCQSHMAMSSFGIWLRSFAKETAEKSAKDSSSKPLLDCWRKGIRHRDMAVGGSEAETEASEEEAFSFVSLFQLEHLL